MSEALGVTGVALGSPPHPEMPSFLTWEIANITRGSHALRNPSLRILKPLYLSHFH